MKSRTSSFKTILRKDILRFAPLWALYLIGGIMILFSGAESGVNATVRNLTWLVELYSVINLIYAALVAQLLFGDLFNSRMCNALHAMPMRRETWFMSHVISGICFSLVPNVIMTLAMLPMLGEYWFIGFVWLLGATSEYLCFFGIAVFSVFCTGNRFAMVAVYGVLNFFSLILLWFIHNIYQPLLYGFAVTEEAFYILSPILKMANASWIETVVDYKARPYTMIDVYITQEWWYLAAYGAVGAVLLGAGLLLYRRRKLECAGNFMAVKSLAPIFSVIFALFVGALFAMFSYGGNGTEDYLQLIFLGAGLIVGYFAGQMLLQRTVKVFKPMAFAKMTILVVAMFASIGLTVWDPLGVEEWVPEKDQVEKVMVSNTYGFSPFSPTTMTLQEADDILKVLQIHENIVENRDLENANDKYFVAIRYYLKNGAQVEREYETGLTSEAYEKLKSFYNRSDIILSYTNWEEYLSTLAAIYVNGYKITGEECRELMEAVKMDCEAGTMAQVRDFRQNNPKAEYFAALGIEIRTSASGQVSKWLSVYTDAKNTVKWLKEHQKLWDPYGNYTFN